MKISLKWFQSEKGKELSELMIEEQKLKNDILRKQLEKQALSDQGATIVDYKYVIGADPYKREKLYKNVKLVNDVLVVVMENGDILTKPGAIHDDYQRIVDASTEGEIYAVVATEDMRKQREQLQREQQKIEALQKGMYILKDLDDFEVKENTVYLKGTSRSLPQMLVEKFIEIAGRYEDKSALTTDEEYNALKKFFMWCCLNPRAEVAEKLYGFLMKNGFKITKQGFFVALRNVVAVNGTDSTLVDFISNAYNKIKGVWKKKPEDYNVWKKNDEYSFHKTDVNGDENSSLIGNLKELYLDLPNMNENRYTDNYTHTFDIRIGQKVWMDPAKASWSQNDCAEAGLHFAGHTAPYVLCGDTTVFTLHNPMKVVGIGSEKGRCWEYLPFMTTTVEEADQIMNSGEFDFLELDEEYAKIELEGLAEKAKAGFVAETTKHEFNLPRMSTVEINRIVLSLEEMNGIIRQRVVNVDDTPDYEGEEEEDSDPDFENWSTFDLYQYLVDNKEIDPVDNDYSDWKDQRYDLIDMCWDYYDNN